MHFESLVCTFKMLVRYIATSQLLFWQSVVKLPLRKITMVLQQKKKKKKNLDDIVKSWYPQINHGFAILTIV